MSDRKILLPAGFLGPALLEPKLLSLVLDLAGVERPRSGRFCANALWYGNGSFKGRGLKPRMLSLVGMYRSEGPPELQTSEAYDLAYRALYALPPPCRNCSCA